MFKKGGIKRLAALDDALVASDATDQGRIM